MLQPRTLYSRNIYREGQSLPNTFIHSVRKISGAHRTLCDSFVSDGRVGEARLLFCRVL